MRRSLILVFIALFGCGDDPAPPRVRPAYVISEDTMAALIAEHYVINARSQDREVRKKRLTDFAKLDQQNLYDSFGITQQKFDTSLHYYLENYRDMIILHQQAMDLLSTRMAELKASGADSLAVEPEVSLEKLKAKNAKP